MRYLAVFLTSILISAGISPLAQAQAQDTSTATGMAQAETATGKAGEAATTAMPRVPNFWDPQATVEKPSRRIVAIRFLTSPDFPPFNFIAPDGRLSGFNVDLAREICETLSAECTIQLRPFADLGRSLEENRGDAIVAGIGISAENRKRFSFSDIYLRFPGRFAALKTAMPDPDRGGLAGKWVAVVANSAHEAFLHAFFSDARIAAYQTRQEALAALKAGKVDAYFGDGMTLGFWLESTQADGCCTFAGGAFLDSTFFGQGMAVALAPRNETLRTAINYALRRIHDSGRYEELYLRYFPISFF